MICSRGATKTIVLKSPDSDRVREVIVTSVLLPKSESENRIPFNCHRNSDDVGSLLERRAYKRRLDHLTLEEKILRKKLKNREAAQTSRDRKKARLEELETAVLQLQNENESLHEEVRSLKDERESLMRENARLTEEVWRLSVEDGASGSAVSPPLPQGVSPSPAFPPHSPPPHRASLLLRLLTLLQSALTIGHGSTTFQSVPPSLKNLSSLQILSLLKPIIQKKQNRRKTMWWGRKQRAWNPVGPVWKVSEKIC